MLLNEVSPDSGIELHAIIGNQTLTFKEKTIAFHLDDKKLLKELNRLTKGYPFVVTPAIKKDDKVITSKKDLKKKDKIEITFQDGNIEAEVL